jgi:hypothetical protein
MKLTVANIYPTKFENTLIRFTSSTTIPGVGEINNGVYYMYVSTLNANVGDVVELDMAGFEVEIQEGKGKDGTPCEYKVLKYVG